MRTLWGGRRLPGAFTLPQMKRPSVAGHHRRRPPSRNGNDGPRADGRGGRLGQQWPGILAGEEGRIHSPWQGVKGPGRPARHSIRTTTYCVTDLKGPNLLVVLQRDCPQVGSTPHSGPGFALGPFLLPAISSGLCLVVSADGHPSHLRRAMSENILYGYLIWLT